MIIPPEAPNKNGFTDPESNQIEKQINGIIKFFTRFLLLTFRALDIHVDRKIKSNMLTPIIPKSMIIDNV